jgi:hypothetical protein
MSSHQSKGRIDIWTGEKGEGTRGSWAPFRFSFSVIENGKYCSCTKERVCFKIENDDTNMGK